MIWHVCKNVSGHRHALDVREDGTGKEENHGEETGI